MKNILRIIPAILFFINLSLCAQNNVSGAILKFDTDGHDYGKIDIEKIPEAKMDIKFSNTGNAPLVISNVKACCGTRVIDWTKEPIMPGKSGVAKIQFEIPPKIHTISRTVTITSNSINSPDVFRIKGEVIEIKNGLIGQ